MNCTEVQARLLEYIWTRQSMTTPLPEALLSHIAGCRTCLAVLDGFSSKVAEQPSTLKATTDQLLTCTECQDWLGAYVESQLAGIDAAIRYPRVQHHLDDCVNCRTEADLLYSTLQTEMPELFTVTNSPPTVAEGRQLPNLWEAVTAYFQRLTVEIPILVGKDAAFGELPAVLAPQLTLAGAFRSKHAESENKVEAIELLTLPYPAADLLIKVSTETVTNHKSTLILQLATMTHQPITQVRTILRHHNGSLLEQQATDADGLVIFGELDTAKYGIQIKHAGQTWEFSVVLTESQ